jgi:hypothetical protein
MSPAVSNWTRHDVSYAVSTLSQFLNKAQCYTLGTSKGSPQICKNHDQGLSLASCQRREYQGDWNWEKDLELLHWLRLVRLLLGISTIKADITKLVQSRIFFNRWRRRISEIKRKFKKGEWLLRIFPRKNNLLISSQGISVMAGLNTWRSKWLPAISHSEEKS